MTPSPIELVPATVVPCKGDVGDACLHQAGTTGGKLWKAEMRTLQRRFALIRRYVLGVSMLVPLFFAQGAQALVINNGTFDNISFWTGTYQIKSAGGGFPSIDTQPYYFGGQTGSNAITQTYTLTSSDLTNLANTGLDFIMSADLFGFSSVRHGLHRVHRLFSTVWWLR